MWISIHDLHKPSEGFDKEGGKRKVTDVFHSEDKQHTRFFHRRWKRKHFIQFGLLTCSFSLTFLFFLRCLFLSVLVFCRMKGENTGKCTYTFMWAETKSQNGQMKTSIQEKVLLTLYYYYYCYRYLLKWDHLCYITSWCSKNLVFPTKVTDNQWKMENKNFSATTYAIALYSLPIVKNS